MSQPLAIIISLVAAYFLGSFPSAYLMGRIRKGIDIRSVGSHNMGAMNSIYNIGFIYGVIVLFARPRQGNGGGGPGPLAG